MIIAIALASSAFTTFLLVPVVRRLALKNNLVDNPEVDPLRRQHKMPVPLFGGIAIAISCLLIGLFFVFIISRLNGPFLQPRYLLGLMAGGTIIMLGGYF